MTEIQKEAFELLCQFVKICKKLDLDFFLVCGSALGAIKYGGFIPWDDDIDIAMKREDYESFILNAPNMLPDNMVLQNIHTHKGFPLLMTKLVNIDTTLIEKPYVKLPIHHGVFVDIFPLDGYPIGRLEGMYFDIKKWIYNKLRCVAYRFGYRLFNLNKIMLCYEAMLKKYKCNNSKIICNHGNWQGKLDYSCADEFGKGKLCSFEGLEVRVPEKYDQYFKRKYGDWLEQPLVEQQCSHHNFLKCDVTRSYTYYFVRQHGRIKIRDDDQL